MKPKCTAQQMIKVIKRNMEIKSDQLKPEHNLILAIIGGAITDLLDKRQRSSAENFFKGSMFDTYCNLISLNPSSTRELLRKGGFISI